MTVEQYQNSAYLAAIVWHRVDVHLPIVRVRRASFMLVEDFA